MEALGAAASVIAVLSLALQLSQAIEITKDFWKNIKAAPGEVDSVLQDLDLLNGILEGIRCSVKLPCENKDPTPIRSIHCALLQCEKHVLAMSEFSRDLKTGFVKRRVMTAFKTTMRREKLAEFRIRLEQAKSTLLLTVNVATFIMQENCSQRVMEQFSELRSEIKMEFAMQASQSSTIAPYTALPRSSPDQDFHRRTIFSTGHQLSASDILLWLLQLPLDSPFRKHLQATGNLIGRVSWHSSEQVTDHLNGPKSYQRTSIISIHLPILQKSFTLQSQRAMGLWTHTLRVTRIVPDNSAIFRICATAENESEIRRIFDEGYASPFDQTTWGVTLLHAAAAGYRCRIYKFLQDSGVQYSLCEHPRYGKLGPIELTQNFTVLAEGKHQTVQKWLSITHDERLVLHPEINYQSVVNIWNACTETERTMTDEEVMTMLQGPLRIPRLEASCDPPKSLPDIVSKPTPRYSSSLLLFCYYFLFRADAYQTRITDAKLYSASPGNRMEGVPLFEYLGKHWDREHWLIMLSHCQGLDFNSLARRQQDKLCPSLVEYGRRRAAGENGKWMRNKRITLAFEQQDETDVRFGVGYLEDFVAIFDFEEEYGGEEFVDEGGKFGSGERNASKPAVSELEAEIHASSSLSRRQTLFLESARLFLRGTAYSIALLYFVYRFIVR